jgi:hypothetical protein
MFFRNRRISHASRANKKKEDAEKLEIPLEMAQKSHETPCQIPVGCNMGIIFFVDM